MNQILSTSLNKNQYQQQNNYQPQKQPKEPKEPKYKPQKKSGPVEATKVVRFFAITAIIFGILLIGTGSYAIYKNKENGNSNVAKTEPSINIEYKTNSSLLVKITHDKAFKKIVYYWNDDTEEEVETPDGQYIDFTIDIPKGTNTLHIVVTDINDVETSVDHQYERESDIVMESDNTKGTVVIKYESETEIEYMTYQWDDEESTQVNINNTTVEQEIEAKKGIHKLTVEMVDVDGEKESNVQQVKGVSRPTVKVVVDDAGENFIVTATDDTGLSKIEYRINLDDSQKYSEELSGTTAEYKIPLQEGETKAEITIYNTNGVTAEAKVKFNK